jgi:Glyoxalase-like domain
MDRAPIVHQLLGRMANAAARPGGTGMLTSLAGDVRAISPSSYSRTMTAPPLQIDHLVVAARTLEEGLSFIAAKLGVEMSGGGAHPLMRTHNRLLNLWGGVYLEVIAVDPLAPAAVTPRPRLFSLDDPALLKRLESGPQLVHWVARVERPKLLKRWQAQYPERIPTVVPLTRGSNSWDITVPDDGAFPAWQGAGDGLLPSLIQWDTPAHPSATLPETGIALRSLTGYHGRAHLISEQLAWLGASDLMRVEVTDGAPSLVAEFELPDGSIVTIGEAPMRPESMETEIAALAETAKPARKRARSKKAAVAADAPEASPASADATDAADVPAETWHDNGQ